MDTNAIIDFFGNRLPSKGESFLDNLVPAISVITRIEVLGWFEITPDQLNRLLPFFSECVTYTLSETIILKTIELRQLYKIKTPDAIIAATALINNQTLISRNVKDFEKISDLSVVNPHDL